ncbi:hypothetical protein [Hoeflea sp. TYP-13]
MTYFLQLAHRLCELQPYPRLSAYLERNLARPVFKRAMERTDG